MASSLKTTMPLLFLTIGCFFIAVCNVDATIESLPPHGSHPIIAPSPHHHHRRHHHHHPKSLAPNPYPHNPHSPAHAPVHHSPIHAPPHHTPVAPVHPPTKAPMRAPTKAPIHPPTKAPFKAPVHSPTKAPFKAPIHPPTKTPVHPPTKAPVKTPVHPPTKAPVKKPIHPPTKAPIDHNNRTSVLVHGAVYCTSCKRHGAYPVLGASLLSGATVKLQCNSHTKYPLVVHGKTNNRGHFYLEAPKTITSKDAHKCKVFLVSSPTKCSHITNLNGGLIGSVLKLDQKFLGKKLSFSLYNVGPLAFEPKCRS